MLCPLLPPVCIEWNITRRSCGTQTVFMPRNSNCCLFYRKESLDYSTWESSYSTTLGKKWRMQDPLGVEQGIFFCCCFLMKDLKIPKCATWAFAELTKKTKTKLSSDLRQCSRLKKSLSESAARTLFCFLECILLSHHVAWPMTRSWVSSTGIDEVPARVPMPSL